MRDTDTPPEEDENEQQNQGFPALGNGGESVDPITGSVTLESDE